MLLPSGVFSGSTVSSPWMRRPAITSGKQCTRRSAVKSIGGNAERRDTTSPYLVIHQSWYSRMTNTTRRRRWFDVTNSGRIPSLNSWYTLPVYPPVENTTAGTSCTTSHRAAPPAGTRRSRTSSIVAMTFASHLRVYGRILSSSTAAAVAFPDDDDTSWNDALAECIRTSPRAKQMSARVDVRSQQRLSFPMPEHGAAATSTARRAAAAAPPPPSSECTKEKNDTGATNSVPTETNDSSSSPKKRRMLNALGCAALPFLPAPPPP
ncbi:Os07g0657300 [Oryza sativa Japonica Group]|uniref:Os07g0657300 protein n=1 Tax=Oryza sativa subsp. japonica TaxID=39947 RepID=Q0D3Z7_ORYSJ|nr:Os07g0657300 [Oryza sativa Japonica Group]|eukprot:NP_001060512.1 Os07g0657300 [Oryza sativa Japonica Group]